MTTSFTGPSGLPFQRHYAERSDAAGRSNASATSTNAWAGNSAPANVRA